MPKPHTERRCIIRRRKTDRHAYEFGLQWALASAKGYATARRQAYLVYADLHYGYGHRPINSTDPLPAGFIRSVCLVAPDGTLTR